MQTALIIVAIGVFIVFLVFVGLTTLFFLDMKADKHLN